jgi:hypothetical protein
MARPTPAHRGTPGLGTQARERCFSRRREKKAHLEVRLEHALGDEVVQVPILAGVAFVAVDQGAEHQVVNVRRFARVDGQLPCAGMGFELLGSAGAGLPAQGCFKEGDDKPTLIDLSLLLLLGSAPEVLCDTPTFALVNGVMA